MIAQTPTPPYFAVIFTSNRTEDNNGYSETSQRMKELAEQQDGYLGMESVRSELGITVSYWRDLESIRQWKMNAEHLGAQKKGKEKWYTAYKTRICKVERDYEFHI